MYFFVFVLKKVFNFYKKFLVYLGIEFQNAAKTRNKFYVRLFQAQSR